MAMTPKSIRALKRTALAGKIVETAEMFSTPDVLERRLVLKTKRGELDIQFGPLAHAKVRKIKRTAKERVFGKEDATGWEVVIRI